MKTSISKVVVMGCAVFLSNATFAEVTKPASGINDSCVCCHQPSGQRRGDLQEINIQRSNGYTRAMVATTANVLIYHPTVAGVPMQVNKYLKSKDVAGKAP